MGSGLATAMALAGGVGDLDRDDELQPELFEPAEAPEPALPAVPRMPSGPMGGRPKGARNKSTEAWRQWFLSRYRSPLTECGEIYSRPLRLLAEQLELYERDVETGEPLRWPNGTIKLLPDAMMTAARLQQEARAAVLPYVHQRQPLAIEAKGEAIGWMVIGDLGQAGEAASDALTLPVIEHEENQGLGDARGDASDECSSDAQAK